MANKIEFHEDDVLVIVDMQEDFVNGPLGNDEAKAIVEPMTEFVQAFPGKKIFTKDTHYDGYLQTQEGRNLPIEHTKYRTPGWNLVEPLEDIADGIPANVLLKDAFGSDVLYHYMRIAKPKNAYFIGVKTGICVISNVVLTKTASPETIVHIIEPLCACVTPESHKTAIDAMRILQIDIVEEIPNITKSTMNNNQSKYVYAITEENVNGAGKDATEYVEFNSKLTPEQLGRLETVLRDTKTIITNSEEDASTSDIVETVLAAFGKNGNPKGSLHGSVITDEIRF